MSKAITGLAEIGAAVGMGTLAFFDPAVLALPGYAQAMGALAIGGISSEIGALADALTANRGQNITTRQPAAFRQIVYGTQRVGGTMVYESTTGSSYDQYNMVIVLATHEVYAIENIYLDGRQVYFQGSGAGWQVRNGYGFGGIADGNDHVGPDGQTYNFGGTGHHGIYIEARYGDQPAGDYIGGLTANDPNWAPGTNGTPSLQGCCYLYVKIEANQNLFPQFPEIRVTLKGKQVLDPRTGQTTYSSNAALCMADYLTDPVWGLNDLTLNQAQLIAAANLCDEQVETATAGLESRYACSWHFDTSTGPGDVLTTIAAAMAAKFSRIGGEWYIFPGAAVAPVLALGPDVLTAKVQWKSARPYRDRINRVRGTYTAPNFPFNCAGDLFDANGWYNGRIQNNFPFAFQATNYAEFACDPLHGYAADQYLAADGGVELVRELGLPAVLSHPQAQRLAKICLLRNRMQQGTGTLHCNLSALQLEPGDTFTLTCPQMGWVDKLLEVTGFEFAVSQTPEGPLIGIVLSVAEYNPEIYAWATTEELSVYDVPSSTSQVPFTPAAPTNMQVDSLVFTQPDGTLLRMLEVTWDTPQDPQVKTIQVQYQQQGASTWWDGGAVSVLSNALLLGNIQSGVTYNVRICSLRSSGATSGWVEADGVATNQLSPIVYQGSPVGQSAVTVSGNTATIGTINTSIGGTATTYYPSGATVSGITPGATNYVYAVDPGLAAGGAATGGSPTPVVTTNQGAYLGKVGYVLIATLNNTN